MYECDVRRLQHSPALEGLSSGEDSSLLVHSQQRCMRVYLRRMVCARDTTQCVAAMPGCTRRTSALLASRDDECRRLFTVPLLIVFDDHSTLLTPTTRRSLSSILPTDSSTCSTLPPCSCKTSAMPPTCLAMRRVCRRLNCSKSFCAYDLRLTHFIRFNHENLQYVTRCGQYSLLSSLSCVEGSID